LLRDEDGRTSATAALPRREGEGVRRLAALSFSVVWRHACWPWARARAAPGTATPTATSASSPAQSTPAL